MSKLQGPIRATIAGKGYSEDRGSQILETAWLKLKGLPQGLPETKNFLKNGVEAPAIVEGGPLLVMVSELAPAASEAAEQAIRNGTRVYLVGSTAWFGKGMPAWVAKAASCGLLLRQASSVPCAMVLGQRQGWLWIGPEGAGDWRLELDAEQCRAARQVFLRVFWEQSIQECWPASGRLAWHPCPPKGSLEIPKPTPDQQVRLEQGAPKVGALSNTHQLLLPAGEIPKGTKLERLLVPPSGDRQFHVAELAATVREIAWIDESLPWCALGDDSEVFAGTSSQTVRVALNLVQTQDLKAILESQPHWVFGADKSLKEVEPLVGVGGQIWLSRAKTGDTLVGEQRLDAGVVPAGSLRDAAGARPKDLAAASPLALAATWAWTVKLPGLPRGCVEEVLVKEWRELDDQFAEQCSKAKAGLEAAKNKEASLEKAFAWLKSAVFGFGRGREGLKSQLDELATKTPSKLGLEEARKAVEDLAEVAHLVREHLGELEAARSKAEIEQERKEQQAKHDQVVKDASEKARKAKTELDRCLDSIRVLRAQMESPDSGSLPPAQGDQSAADLKVQKARFDDDMRKLEKERVGLETALANHENVASRVFEFKPRKQGQKTGPKGGTSFVAAASAKRSGQVPAEVLPVTGRLMAYQGKRYLAIAKWDELDTGEIESGRLKASLVADLEDE